MVRGDVKEQTGERVAIAESVTSIRVRYADTDQMRIVHHAKYFEYFELGRSDLIRNLGMSYAQLEEKGIYLPVIEAVAHYQRPAHYDELILVRSRVYDLPKATLKIDYVVFNEDQSQQLCYGWTVHGFLKAETGKPIRAPHEFLTLFTAKS